MGKIKKRTREPIQFYSSNSYHHHKWHLKKCIKQSKVNSSDGLIDYMVFPPALFLDFFSHSRMHGTWNILTVETNLSAF